MSYAMSAVAASRAQQSFTATQGSTGIPLSLGNVTFQSTEIPENFGPLGGAQKLAVHEFPGGIRTVQPLGSFAHPITWEGWLIGNNALARSAALDNLEVQGAKVTLTFGTYSQTGFVAKYDGQVKTQYLVRYSISFVPALSGPVSTGAPASPNSIFSGAVMGLTQLVAATSLPSSDFGELP